MKRLVERQLIESFSSPWIPMEKFRSIKLHLRTQPGSNAAGSFAIIGSDDPAVDEGLWDDPLFAGAMDDESDVTSACVASLDLAQPARANGVISIQADDVPAYIRLDYTHTSGTRGLFTVDVESVCRRGASADTSSVSVFTDEIALADSANVPAGELLLPTAGTWILSGAVRVVPASAFGTASSIRLDVDTEDTGNIVDVRAFISSLANELPARVVSVTPSNGSSSSVGTSIWGRVLLVTSGPCTISATLSVAQDVVATGEVLLVAEKVG